MSMKGSQTPAQENPYRANNATEMNNGTTAEMAAVTVMGQEGQPMKKYYCWSHGIGLNKNCTSGTHSNKKDGHKDDATADNMMGGCDRIMSGCRARPANGNANGNAQPAANAAAEANEAGGAEAQDE